MAIDIEKATDEQVEEQLKQWAAEKERRQKEARAAGLKRVRHDVQQFGFTQEEVFGGGKAPSKLYRNPADPYGKGWTGKGRKPQWLQNWLDSGKTLDDLPA